MTPDKLTLPCAGDRPSDNMQIDTVSALKGDEGLLQLIVFAGDGSSCQYLNKDTARQLFNWLGVWLHSQ